MKIRIPNIPADGLSLQFELPSEKLNARIEKTREGSPTYDVISPPQTDLRIELQRLNVFINGDVDAQFRTICSRCAEETEFALHVPIKLTMKPKSKRAIPGADDEGLEFGVYEGEEIDCGDIVEEYIILALPFTVLCSENCKGLCATCGVNLNRESCHCQQEEEEKTENPFSVLRGLKIQ